MIFGVLLILRRNEWNPIKLVGLLGFYISITSLIAKYKDNYKAFFNIFQSLETAAGTEISLLFFLALLLGSLYAVFGISYSKILKKVGSHTKEAWVNMRSAREEEYYEEEKIAEKPARKSLKADKINAELEKIQNSKNTKIIIEKHEQNENIEPM